MIARRTVLQGIGAALVSPIAVKLLLPEPMRVWSSHQSGYGLTVEPLPGVLRLGEVITIDGVECWHRIDNTPTRWLRQFVVTRRAEPGHRVLFLYPPIIGEHDSQYRTVVELPMNKAQIRVVEPS